MNKLKSSLFMFLLSVFSTGALALHDFEADGTTPRAHGDLEAMTDGITLENAASGVATIGGSIMGVLIVMLGLGFILSMLRRR